MAVYTVKRQRETGSSLVNIPGYLSGPNLKLKARRISEEALVFRLSQFPESLKNHGSSNSVDAFIIKE